MQRINNKFKYNIPRSPTFISRCGDVIGSVEIPQTNSESENESSSEEK